MVPKISGVNYERRDSGIQDEEGRDRKRRGVRSPWQKSFVKSRGELDKKTKNLTLVSDIQKWR